MSSEIEKAEKLQEEIELKARNWWRWFWGTIAFLFTIYLSAKYLENYELSKSNTLDTKEGRANYLIEIKDTLSKVSPELVKYISNLSELSKESIKKKIHQEVSIAYEPVYSEGIKNFSDFHYSVSGEYIELYNTSADGARSYFKMEKKDNFDTLVYEMLFKSTNFDTHLKGAFTKINDFAIEEIVNNNNQLQKKVQTDLNISKTQTNFIVNDLLKMSSSDMKNRFNNEVSAGFRVGGVSSGAMIGAVASKQIAKMFTKKMATKVAIKATSKAAGAAVGATAGGVEGLVCGPGAPVCSTIGAVIGGVVGWFSTDAIVVKADEYYNHDKFEEELRVLIEEQQLQTEEELYEVYTRSLESINAESREKLESFKHIQNKEHL